MPLRKMPLRKIIILLVLALAGFFGGALLLAAGAIDTQPKVLPRPDLSFDRVKRVKDLVRQHTPRSMGFRQVRQVRISQEDLNLLLDYGLSQGLNTDRAAADISLSDTQVTLTASLRMPPTPMGAYLNLDLGIRLDSKALEIAFVRAGALTIPGRLIRPLIPVAGSFLDRETQGLIRKILKGIRSASVSGNTLHLVYDWNPDALISLRDSGKARLLPRALQERLVDYTGKITRILTDLEPSLAPSGSVSLARVIRPLFLYASGRSGSPAKENTALLQALALYSVGQGLDRIVDADLMRRIPQRRPARFTLFGRQDLAKHFLVSAALGVSAGSRLSHFAGLAKEVEDAGRGSGFSFADLAADKAGVRMAELAAGPPGRAARLQQAMARVERETEFMPDIARLPEGITEFEFKRRFTDLDSQTYAKMDREIRQRIDGCRVYRETDTD